MKLGQLIGYKNAKNEKERLVPEFFLFLKIA